VVSLMRRRYNVDIPLHGVINARTIEALARAAEATTAEERVGSRLRRLRPGTTGCPLVFVHPIGGTVFCYQDLIGSLPTGRPAFGLEYGAGGADTLDKLAGEYASDIVRELGTEPVILVGWSLGGAIAHAVAAQLADRGADVRLVAIDSWLPTSGPLHAAAGALAASLAALADSLLAGEPLTDDQLVAVLPIVGRRDGELTGLTAEALGELVRGWAALASLVSRYQPQPLGVPGILAQATQRAEGLATDASAVESWSVAVDLVRVESVAGDHFTIIQPPAVTALAAVLTAMSNPEKTHG
jgi:thioesterase domain-containing protein